MVNIELMYHDGLIGNRGMLVALSSFATGNLNSKIKQGSTPYRMEQIIPMSHDYIVPPLTDEEKAEQLQRNLLSYMKFKRK